jgi:hypothetical protein
MGGNEMSSSSSTVSYKYILHEVVTHSGSLNDGHYISYIRKYENDNGEENITGRKGRRNKNKEENDEYYEKKEEEREENKEVEAKEKAEKEEEKEEKEEEDDNLQLWCFNDASVSVVNWTYVKVFFYFVFVIV